jgi:hypothetical protein
MPLGLPGSPRGVTIAKFNLDMIGFNLIEVDCTVKVLLVH